MPGSGAIDCSTETSGATRLQGVWMQSLENCGVLWALWAPYPPFVTGAILQLEHTRIKKKKTNKPKNKNKTLKTNWILQPEP